MYSKMAKKEEIIIMRVSREFKASLQKKAKERGVSLSRLIEDGLSDTYKADKEQVASLIAKKKEERPEYWQEIGKSPIAREFEEFITALYTEYVNPISRDPSYQPVVLLGSINLILSAAIKNFDSIPEEHQRAAADRFFMIGRTLAEGLVHIKARDRETQEGILTGKTELLEQVAYHLTSMAFSKESFDKIKAEAELVRDRLIGELKTKD